MLNLFIVASRYRADILLTGRSRDHKFRQCFPWQMRSLNTGLPVSVFEYFIYEIRKRYRRPWKPAKERCNRDKFFLGLRPRVRKPHKHTPRFFFVLLFLSSFNLELHSYVTLCAVSNARSMTSNAIRGIRRKKSSLCEVKVAVIGAPGVGKSGEYYVLSRILLHLFVALSFAWDRKKYSFFFD